MPQTNATSATNSVESTDHPATVPAPGFENEIVGAEWAESDGDSDGTETIIIEFDEELMEHEGVYEDAKAMAILTNPKSANLFEYRGYRNGYHVLSISRKHGEDGIENTPGRVYHFHKTINTHPFGETYAWRFYLMWCDTCIWDDYSVRDYRVW